MYLHIPYILFSWFLTRGLPPSAAMIASDILLLPASKIVMSAWTWPCVVDGKENQLVDGPPISPENALKSAPYYGGWPHGFITANCYNRDIDEFIFLFGWRQRGLAEPQPPWESIPCAFRRTCFSLHFWSSSAPIHW